MARDQLVLQRTQRSSPRAVRDRLKTISSLPQIRVELQRISTSISGQGRALLAANLRRITQADQKRRKQRPPLRSLISWIYCHLTPLQPPFSLNKHLNSLWPLPRLTISSAELISQLFTYLPPRLLLCSSKTILSWLSDKNQIPPRGSSQREIRNLNLCPISQVS